MRKLPTIALWLTFAQAISGCVPSGAVQCPRLPALTKDDLAEPMTGKQVRAELFEPPTNATPKCADCKTN